MPHDAVYTMSKASIDDEIRDVEAKIVALQLVLRSLQAARDLAADTPAPPVPKYHGPLSTNLARHPGRYETTLPGGKWHLANDEYCRYGRQMIVPEFGLLGQLKLRSSSALIIGLGGLGCPSSMYLSGAGIARLGLIDPDTVELSNLHRQTLHNTSTIKTPKVVSAARALKKINHLVNLDVYHEALNVKSAERLFQSYDIILDCTDHPAIRYLISDVAVRCGKPVISGAALGTNGQLMVLNDPPRPVGDKEGGPCYRCVFPKPPPAHMSSSCSEAGILGPIVGTIGVLMALKTIQVLIRNGYDPSIKHELLIFSGFPTPSFRNVKLRSRAKQCIACGEQAVHRTELDDQEYVTFCSEGLPPEVKLEPGERLTAVDYYNLYRYGKKEHILVDVREKPQFDVASLAGSVNLPFSKADNIIEANEANGLKGISQTVSAEGLNTKEDQKETDNWMNQKDKPVVVICKLGNDSQPVTRKLKQHGWSDVKDVQGGLEAWRKEVDPTWPDF